MKISNLLTRLRIWWQQRGDADLEGQVCEAIDDLSPDARLRVYWYISNCCDEDLDIRHPMPRV